MLLENIHKTFEDSLYGSLDYRISEFILLNAYDMQQYSINDIALALNIPKSSVASYFSRNRLKGGYVLFQRALKTELGTKSISIDQFLRQNKEFINRAPRRIQRLSPAIFETITSEVLKSRKILIIGPKEYRESSDSLSSLLWYKKIPNRYIIAACAGYYDKELKSLTDEDLVIFLYPSNRYNELVYFINSFPQVNTTLLGCSGRKIFILSDDREQSSDEPVINFSIPSNRIEARGYVDLFMIQLTLHTAEAWSLGGSQLICIA